MVDKAPIGVPVSDGPALDRCIKQLREASKNSSYHGGEYSVFLVQPNAPTVRFDVHIKKD